MYPGTICILKGYYHQTRGVATPGFGKLSWDVEKKYSRG